MYMDFSAGTLESSPDHIYIYDASGNLTSHTKFIVTYDQVTDSSQTFYGVKKWREDTTHITAVENALGSSVARVEYERTDTLLEGRYTDVRKEYDAQDNVVYHRQRLFQRRGNTISYTDTVTTSNGQSQVYYSQYTTYIDEDDKEKWMQVANKINGAAVALGTLGVQADQTGLLGDEKVIQAQGSQTPGSAPAQGGGGGTQPGSGSNGENLPPADQARADASKAIQDYWGKSREEQAQDLEDRGVLSAEQASRFRELADSQTGRRNIRAITAAKMGILQSEGFDSEQRQHLLSILGNKESAIDYLVKYYMSKGMTEEEARKKANAVYNRLRNVSERDIAKYYAYKSIYERLIAEGVSEEDARQQAEEESDRVLSLSEEEARDYLIELGLSDEDAESLLTGDFDAKLLGKLGLVDMSYDEIRYFNALNENHALYNYLTVDLGFSQFRAEVILGMKFLNDGRYEILKGKQGLDYLKSIFDEIPEDISADIVEKLKDAIVDAIFKGDLTPDNAAEYIKKLIANDGRYEILKGKQGLDYLKSILNEIPEDIRDAIVDAISKGGLLPDNAAEYIRS